MADKEWGLRARLNAYTASGTTGPLETTVLDMNGFESVLFVGISSVTATGQGLRMLYGTATTTGTGFETVIGDSSQTATGGLALDVYRPGRRFVQGRMTASDASAPARGLIALRYGARTLPTTQDTSGVFLTSLYSPASGTAT